MRSNINSNSNRTKPKETCVNSVTIIFILMLIMECSRSVGSMIIRSSTTKAITVVPFVSRRSSRLFSSTPKTKKEILFDNAALANTTTTTTTSKKTNINVKIKLEGAATDNNGLLIASSSAPKKEIIFDNAALATNTNTTGKKSNINVKINLKGTATDTNDLLVASLSSSFSDGIETKLNLKPRKRTRSNSTSSGSGSSNSDKSTVTDYQLFSQDLEKINPKSKWIDLHVSPSELRPSTCLTTGQCFNWHVVQQENQPQTAATKATSNSNNPSKAVSAWGIHNAIEWVGPIGNSVFSIRETPTTTLYRVLYSTGDSSNIKDQEQKMNHILQDYFQLSSFNLSKLYERWSKCDPVRFAPIAKCIPGVRLMRQDPFECLISFLCSSNNNIPRITLMLSRIRRAYGHKLIDLPQQQRPNDNNDRQHDDPSSSLLSIYSFPTLNDLSNATENDLRLLGFGYRAKYVHQSCSLLQSLGGEQYLHDLRNQTNNNNASMVQKELLQFNGIGRKVADCIALFSLDVHNAIPVDVHVWHIACRDYDKTLLDTPVLSLTPTMYNRVANLFRTIFGDAYSGWAHSILFVAELPSFKSVLPLHIVQDMEKFKTDEKERKKRLKGTNISNRT